jgi:hypothetical protein
VLRRVKEPTSDACTFQTGLAASSNSQGFALDFSALGTIFPVAGNYSNTVPGPVLTDLKDGEPVGFSYGPQWIEGWCAMVRKATFRPISCCRRFRQARHFVAVLPFVISATDGLTAGRRRRLAVQFVLERKPVAVQPLPRP